MTTDDYSRWKRDVERMKSEDSDTLAAIASWEHGRIQAAVTYARKVGALSGDPLARDVSKWDRFSRGVVFAADWYLRERPDRAAKLAQIGTTPEAKR